MLNMFI